MRMAWILTPSSGSRPRTGKPIARSRTPSDQRDATELRHEILRAAQDVVEYADGLDFDAFLRLPTEDGKTYRAIKNALRSERRDRTSSRNLAGRTRRSGVCGWLGF